MEETLELGPKEIDVRSQGAGEALVMKDTAYTVW